MNATDSNANEETLEFKLRQLPSEKLLAMRAEGDGLADAWHQAIEKIFSERGEYLPPIPQQPIVVQQNRDEPSFVKIVVGGVGIVAVHTLSKMLALTWLGWLVTIGIIASYFVNRLRRKRLSEKDRQHEDEEKRADEDRLNDLMKAAASGNLARVEELLAYKAFDIDAKSLVGSTALMYAARNGHLKIVERLLSSGANPEIRTDKGSTAEAIARRHGHTNIAERLTLK